MTGSVDLDDPMADFEPREVELGGITKRVHVSGVGPAVVVMAEIPGISPKVLRFARWVREAGFTVYLPSLFGVDGAAPRAEAGLAVMQRACVSVEFRALGADETSPVTTWLRRLARLAFAECGGRGVGAVGMCFTGNFALAMMLEPAVVAPVMCQPSLPLDNPAGLGISPGDMDAVRGRLEAEQLTVLGFRFAGDTWCRAERFRAFSAALGDGFVERVLDDADANPDPGPFFADVVSSPHSVVTAHLVDEDGHPTLQARDEILRFLRLRLLVDNAEDEA